MDENKIIKLLEIDYQLHLTCYTCKHSKLNGMWGTCNIHTYKHLKHVGEERQLSINQFGVCKDYAVKFDLSEFHWFSKLMIGK